MLFGNGIKHNMLQMLTSALSCVGTVHFVGIWLENSSVREGLKNEMNNVFRYKLR